MSEASPETHNSPLKETKSGTVGIPVMDTDTRIVDEETGETELPLSQMGELVIQGPQVMKGYRNRPQDTREAVLYKHPTVKECPVVGKPDPMVGRCPRPT